VLDALLGQPDAGGRDHLVQQNNGSNGTYALRVGDWKLHRHDRETAHNVVVEKKLANTPVPRYQLFHLREDPAEQRNLIVQHPQRAQQMKARLEKIIADGRTR
jgi:arylsulfatase A